MCGIAALVGRSGSSRLDRVIASLAHRGPDGEGSFALPDGTTSLAHRRLAIIDPEGGRQPILGAAGQSALVHNGMIYNYQALRGDLSAARFNTETDSETILHLIARDGPAAVRQLDGMFAFVIAEGDRVVAARDPVGIKPLYIGEAPEGTYFASEIKALDGVTRNIRAFPPGHVYVSGVGFEPYYTVPEPSEESWSAEDAAVALRDTLEAAVVKRLRSDVPLGCFLSGGLDSSIITALARKHLDELHTFAVGLEGSRDLIAARRVAAHLDTVHHELVLQPAEIEAALSDVLFHLESFDRDLVRSAVPCFFVSKLAAERVKVVLTGEGADELFAGYGYYAGYGDMAGLQAELRRSITSMHDINLQRVDRMTMAHGLEARVPFLDTAMIDLAMRIPAALKTRDPVSGEPVEKYILRRAFEDLLPKEIAWRTKLQFDEGSGLADFMRLLSEGATEGSEEAFYKAQMAARFDDPETAIGLVSRWDSEARISA